MVEEYKFQKYQVVQMALVYVSPLQKPFIVDDSIQYTNQYIKPMKLDSSPKWRRTILPGRWMRPGRVCYKMNL